MSKSDTERPLSVGKQATRVTLRQRANRASLVLTLRLFYADQGLYGYDSGHISIQHGITGISLKVKVGNMEIATLNSLTSKCIA